MEGLEVKSKNINNLLSAILVVIFFTLSIERFCRNEYFSSFVLIVPIAFFSCLFIASNTKKIN